jgi:hypothetical protein
MNQPATPVVPDKKSVGKWIALLVFPVAALFLIIILQIIIGFTFTTVEGAGPDTSQPAVILVNAFCILLGIVAFVDFLLYPAWIVMIVKTINYNNATAEKRLNQVAAIIFAVLFAQWTWLYTYEKDKVKFWLNTGLTIVTFGIWGIVAWIWAIIDTASRPEEFYSRYPDYVPGHT